MPSTIAYDPSLALANVVDPAALANFEQMAATKAPIDAAHESLNSLISTRRSMDSTSTELRTLASMSALLKKSSRY